MGISAESQDDPSVLSQAQREAVTKAYAAQVPMGWDFFRST